ncbi:MAG TPA: serine/threonine-protein kinase, partial [Candidatus Paceibacterota bacterium]|nr:serine/threonine-protein kinase [Candidatus Paceibacterota bacterium]
RLNHPHIVAVHDFGQVGGQPYLVMEFVDGPNLRQVEQAGRLTAAQALEIVPQICEALQFAHNEGVVHRDIKPENILLDKKGRVKITDFGIAKILGATSGKDSLTGAKDVVGTPHYMAPEQVEHPQAVDHRADIYSLGVVFYELLTGELPLGRFQPPSKKVQVDVRLDEVVLHTLEKEPERRYQHVSEVKTDVETIAATPKAATASARPPVPPVVIKRWRDAWIWNWEYIQLFLIVPLVAGGLVLPFLLPRFGLRALWVFAFELAGIAFAITYAIVGRQVRRVREQVPRTERDVAECLMFRRPFQSPGVAVMHDDRLELKPIVGSPSMVPLADIVAVKEVRWFNGTRLWFKRGFVMDLATGQRVGVAVAEVFARRWRARLSQGCLPEIPPRAEWERSQAGGALAPATGKTPGGESGWLRRSLIPEDTAARWAQWLSFGAALAILVLGFLELPKFDLQPHELFFGILLVLILALVMVVAGYLVGAAGTNRRRQELAPKPHAPAASGEEGILAMARQAVKAPASWLVATATLNWVSIPLAAVVIVPLAEQSQGLPALHLSNTLVEVVCVASLVLCSVVLFAALKMQRLEAYRLAMIGSLLAIFVAPGNIIGLPVGIWSLAVLSRREVREAFGQARRLPPESPRPKRGSLACMTVAVMALLVWYSDWPSSCSVFNALRPPPGPTAPKSRSRPGGRGAPARVGRSHSIA